MHKCEQVQPLCISNLSWHTNPEAQTGDRKQTADDLLSRLLKECHDPQNCSPNWESAKGPSYKEIVGRLSQVRQAAAQRCQVNNRAPKLARTVPHKSGSNTVARHMPRTHLSSACATTSMVSWWVGHL
ncbi:unnamed protein product [Cladocopium goreaui]|uniref:Uncharacterized protein n=1 Tax=Cladocopium goreaui TaxID=2562237 RepID=A0A9P1FIZ0_9DINO|nr:unnamed protein product [Cladocopium goreaui]